MRRTDDGAQLMLVSGIVITIAFLLTALTLTQVASIERQSAADKPTSLGAEWRFLHDRLKTNLQTAVTVDTTNDTLNNTTFPAITATFRNIEAEKGYDLVLRIAGNQSGSGFYNKTEWQITTLGMGAGSSYANWSYDGGVHYTWPVDGVNDGLIWNKPCLDASAPAAGCIQGVLVSLHLSDSTTSLDEVILVPVNTG